MTRDDVYTWLAKTITTGTKAVIGSHNLHSLYLWETDCKFRTFSENADLVLIDGFPVLQLAKWSTGNKMTKHHRIGSLDWLPDVVLYAPIHKLAVVGGNSTANADTVTALDRKNPDCIVRGWSGQMWNPDRAVQVVYELQHFEPDVVVVGLGMPLQERFLEEYWDDLPNSVFATVGGAIDQIAGVQSPAPRWMGPIGLEWLWRLASQPRRLGRRYLIEPWLLLFHILRRKIKCDGGRVVKKH